MDLSNTYTDRSELQAFTAPRLISTIHKTPQHSLLPSTVPTQRLLTVEILQLHALKCSLHSLELSSKLFPCLFNLATNHIENISLLCLCHCCACAYCYGNVLTEPLPKTALVYPPISVSLHNNGSTRYSISLMMNLCGRNMAQKHDKM
jgi:hypothetical protein